MSRQNKKNIDWRDKKPLVILLSIAIILLLGSIISITVVILTVNRNEKENLDNTTVSSIIFDDTVILAVPTKEADIVPVPFATSTPTPVITPIPSQEPTPSPIPSSTPTSTPTSEPTTIPEPTAVPESALSSTPAPTKAPTKAPKPKKEMPKLLSNPEGERDGEGRLLQFEDLLEANSDVIGWIKDSTMDYVVLQSSKNNPEYYLFKDFFGDYYKAGSLFLDPRSSVEAPTQNFVIHGHNMISTPEKMFHYIKFYKDVSFYKKHPVISFDTIYEEGDYKVFAIIKTTPKVKKDYFFEYRQSEFANSSDFLNFVYQIRIRSLIIVDDVDINENDILLTLSTCSYEVNNDYRTVIFARKIRKGESKEVDMNTVKVNKAPLYCEDYYKQNGGKAPKLPATFEKALKKGIINWYNPPK